MTPVPKKKTIDRTYLNINSINEQQYDEDRGSRLAGIDRASNMAVNALNPMRESRASFTSTPSNVGQLFNTRPATSGSGIGGISGGLKSAINGLRTSKQNDLPRGGEMDTTMFAAAGSPMKQEK